MALYDEPPRGGRGGAGRWKVEDVTDLDRSSREQPRRRRGQGELETQVLAALHRAPSAVTASWVQQRLGGTLAYTTVITILTRLHAKGAVARRRAGRSFEWTALADAAGLAALRMRKVLDAESDREAVLAHFLTSLTSEDEQLLRELLAPDQGERED